MNLNQENARRRGFKSGMTLIELAIVLMVLLTLVTVLMFGARGWKKGTDRARCIVNIRQMQLSVRAYSTLKGYRTGQDLSLETPPVFLLGEMVGPGEFVPALPVCPGKGLYHFGGDIVPDLGVLYMTCSLASPEGHVPGDYQGW